MTIVNKIYNFEVGFMYNVIIYRGDVNKRNIVGCIQSNMIPHTKSRVIYGNTVYLVEYVYIDYDVNVVHLRTSCVGMVDSTVYGH